MAIPFIFGNTTPRVPSPGWRHPHLVPIDKLTRLLFRLNIKNAIFIDVSRISKFHKDAVPWRTIP